MKRRILLAGICLLLAGSTQARIDPIYRAGVLAGRTFFWLPIDPVFPDTIGWSALQLALPPGERDSATGMRAAAVRLARDGWALYRLDRCSALSAALLAQQERTHVCVLSQWHAALGRKTVLPRPGMPLAEMRHSMVTDYQWEEVARAAIEAPAGTDGEWRVSLWFGDAGYCDYAGRDPVVGDNRQIRGTDGLSVSIDEVGYHEDLNVRRQVFEVYMVVEASRDAKAVMGAVEKAMDARKLDLSYAAPVAHKVGP